MNPIPILSSVLGLAFASGVNLYAAVLVVGLGIRFGLISGLPGDLNTLANPIVLGVAGTMYFLEFFADKIPYVSVAWDSIHTFIRPVGGAALALASTAKLSPEMQALAMLAGGSVALGTHSTKMGYRLLAHASPEPVTDSVFSMAEDFGVVGLVLLTYKHPAVALAVIGALLAGMAIALPYLIRIIKLAFQGITGRIASWFGSPGSGNAAPDWLPPEQAGGEVYRAFARRVPKAPSLQQGYLIVGKDKAAFAYRGWFKTRVLELDPANLRVTRGLLFDVVAPDAEKGGWSVYLTKDCSTYDRYPGADGNSPRASSNRIANASSSSSS